MRFALFAVFLHMMVEFSLNFTRKCGRDDCANGMHHGNKEEYSVGYVHCLFVLSLKGFGLSLSTVNVLFLWFNG